MLSKQSLLAEDEPTPFRVLNERGTSPFMIIGDHAGRSIPRALGSLGLNPHDQHRHIAWDIGVAGLARHLGNELRAWVILQEYSRLVIDCNRPLESPQSILQESDGTVIAGNLAIGPEQARMRALSIFEPYHARIRQELAGRAARKAEPILIFLHSFTPEMRGQRRPWHAGVLSHRDKRVATPLLAALRAEPDLVVGDNEPYQASEATDFGLIEHGERRGLPHVELEIRQDLLVDAAGQRAWAERLARLLATLPMASN